MDDVKRVVVQVARAIKNVVWINVESADKSTSIRSTVSEISESFIMRVGVVSIGIVIPLIRSKYLSLILKYYLTSSALMSYGRRAIFSAVLVASTGQHCRPALTRKFWYFCMQQALACLQPRSKETKKPNCRRSSTKQTPDEYGQYVVGASPSPSWSASQAVMAAASLV